MTNQGGNAKRLAKNTVYMYVRMVVLMVIALFTSRIVLRELGVEDYGIYSLVGSIVAMFSSLRTLFASSTQRFLNFEMGRGNNDRLWQIFSMSILVNAIIAIIFVVCVEAVGYWFLNYKINISPDRLLTAKWVFQLSVASAVVTLMTTPFDAVLIAHEKMNAFAGFSILEGMLKLGTVCLLMYYGADKLLFYAVMQLCVAVIMRMINSWYCTHYFSESRFRFFWDKAYLKKMLSFAGWNFFGNTAYTLTHNGLNMIMNVFGGPVLNAARGIAYNVNTMAEQFVNNIVVVVNPYCYKTYAEGNRQKFMQAIFLSSKVLFSVQICLTLPVIFLTKELLGLWLGQIPPYSVLFVQLILINTQIRSLHQNIDTLFKAVGDLKYYQIVENVILLLPIAASYIALRYGAPYYSVFLFVILFNVIAFFAVLLVARRVAELHLRDYLVSVLCPCTGAAILMGIMFKGMDLIAFSSLFLRILYTSCSLLLVMLFIYLCGLNVQEKIILRSIIKKH